MTSRGRHKAVHVVAIGKSAYAEDCAGEDGERALRSAIAADLAPPACQHEEYDEAQRQNEVCAVEPGQGSGERHQDKDQRHADALAELKIEIVGHETIAQNQFGPGNAAIGGCRF